MIDICKMKIIFEHSHNLDNWERKK